MDLALKERGRGVRLLVPRLAGPSSSRTARVRRPGRRGRVGPPVAGEPGRGQMGRCPLAERIRRAQRDAGPSRPLPERVRPLAGAPAGEPRRDQPGRADAARPRHRRPTSPLHAAHPLGRGDLVPALQRARRGKRPGLVDDARDAGRRRVPRHRAQGVDVVRPVRHLGSLPGPHRSRGRASPTRHHRVDRRHGRPRGGGAAVGADDRRCGVQRGVPDRRLRPRRACHRRGGAGLDRRRLHAGPRAGDELPVQGASGARDVPRPPLRRGAGQRRAGRPAGRRRPRGRLRRSQRPASAQPAHADAPRAWRGTRSRVQLDQALVDRHDTGDVRRRALGHRTRSPVGRGRAVGPAVAVEQGRRHRGRDVTGPARHHRREDPRPAASRLATQSCTSRPAPPARPLSATSSAVATVPALRQHCRERERERPTPQERRHASPKAAELQRHPRFGVWAA